MQIEDRTVYMLIALVTGSAGGQVRACSLWDCEFWMEFIKENFMEDMITMLMREGLMQRYAQSERKARIVIGPII